MCPGRLFGMNHYYKLDATDSNPTEALTEFKVNPPLCINCKVNWKAIRPQQILISTLIRHFEFLPAPEEGPIDFYLSSSGVIKPKIRNREKEGPKLSGLF